MAVIFSPRVALIPRTWYLVYTASARKISGSRLLTPVALILRVSSISPYPSGWHQPACMNVLYVIHITAGVFIHDIDQPPFLAPGRGVKNETRPTTTAVVFSVCLVGCTRSSTI